MEKENETFIFNVKVGEEEKKVIDLVFLKNVLEGLKAEYSVLNLNPLSVEKDDTVHSYMAKAACDSLSKVEFLVNSALGLIPEASTEDEIVEDEEPEVSAEDIVEEVSRYEPVKDEDITDKPDSSAEEEKIVL